jgi:hypothetical protein
VAAIRSAAKSEELAEEEESASEVTVCEGRPREVGRFSEAGEDQTMATRKTRQHRKRGGAVLAVAREMRSRRQPHKAQRDERADAGLTKITPRREPSSGLVFPAVLITLGGLFPPGNFGVIAPISVLNAPSAHADAGTRLVVVRRLGLFVLVVV